MVAIAESTTISIIIQNQLVSDNGASKKILSPVVWQVSLKGYVNMLSVSLMLSLSSLTVQIKTFIKDT